MSGLQAELDVAGQAPLSSVCHDVVVVGGGIVGLATALALSASPRLRLALIEAEPGLARHQTGHNSGVIHSGLYYKPGSDKAVTCTRGQRLMYRFCEEEAIAHERCGKLVVAAEPAELPRLDELCKRGEANGLKGLERLGPEALADREPHVAGSAGLWVPDTGIVDYREVAAAMTRRLRAAGTDISTGARLTRVARDSGELRLETSRGCLRARYLVNCAGLQSDRVARLCGLRPELSIVPFRGDYQRLLPERSHLVRNLIYPVPDPKFPFLGVHFTRQLGGGVEAGPTAVLALARGRYSRWGFSLRDAASIAVQPGVWRLLARHRRMALQELQRGFSKDAFVRALRRLVPEVQAADLRPGGCGIRAQAVEPSGRLVDDFHIQTSSRAVHVLNAPSPAATASLAIGQSIASLCLKHFELAGQGPNPKVFGRT